MGKGTFQERLCRAIQGNDELTIRIWDSGDGPTYSVRVSSSTENYGRLAAEECVAVEKATPGQLIGAIEKAKEKIETTVQMMLDAQDDDSE